MSDPVAYRVRRYRLDPPGDWIPSNHKPRYADSDGWECEGLVPATPDWRSPETAPRDGTAIIAWWPHLGRPVIAWFRDQRRKGGLGPGWIVSHHTTHAALMHGGSEPRCWMPVPAIPEWAR